MSTLAWLHLSDWHWREKHGYDTNIVFDKLLEDLKRRADFAPEVDKINLVFVTGDIAFSGCARDYALAQRFLKELRATIGIRKERLFIVPGNHDVDRSLITNEAKTHMAKLKTVGAVTRLLNDQKKRTLVLKRLLGYRHFVNEELRQNLNPSSYFYVKRRSISERTIAILGLNSAWASKSDQDRLHLFLGEPQVRTAIKQSEKADIRIALMHHPFEYMQDADSEACERLLLSHCNFVLQGHLHKPEVRQLRAPRLDAMIIGAGACYDTRESQNAYNLVHLDFESGRGTIYLRMYSNHDGGFWTEDNLTYHGLKGKYDFDLLEEWGIPKTIEMPVIQSKSVVTKAKNPARLSTVDGWWKKRGYRINPFQFPDAKRIASPVDIGESIPSKIFELWHVDPKAPVDQYGVGSLTLTIDNIMSLDTSGPVLIYAPAGGGKTFYRRWAANQIEESGKRALEIYNPASKVSNPHVLTPYDLASCILKTIDPTKIPNGEYVEHVFDACEHALKFKYPSLECIYVFMDNMEQFLDERPSSLRQNSSALDAIAGLCTTAAKRGDGLIALRVFLPLSLKEHLDIRLGSKHLIRDEILMWKPESWRAIAERRLACARKHRAKSGRSFSELLSAEVELELNRWFKNQSQLTPRCVIEVLDQLADFASSVGFAQPEPLSLKQMKFRTGRTRSTIGKGDRIGIEVWEAFSKTWQMPIPCGADTDYPVEKLDIQSHVQPTPNTSQARLFVSYSSKDEKVATQIADGLKNAGLECWLDKKDILIGEPILDRVREGITKESDFTLIILSTNSVASEWCKLELRLAYMKETQHQRIVILPVRIDTADVPEEVSIKKYYQFDPASKASLDSLIQEITSVIRKQT